MNKKVIAGLMVFITLLGAAGYKLYFPKESGITATGTIEVTLADVVPQISGYMTDLQIEVGDPVKVGQIITHISRSDLKDQLDEAQASLTEAKDQLANLEAGSRPQEIQAADANMAATQASYIKAKNDLARYRQLYQDGAIAAQQLDAAQSAYDVAYNSFIAAQSQQSLTSEGNRPDVIEAQQAEVERSKAALAVAQDAVADMVVVSPLNGVVLTKNYENGEYVNPSSAIATIGDLNDCWVKIYVSTKQLGLIRLGQSAEVRIDAYPERVFAGTIKEISQNAEFTPRQSITQDERDNLVFYVKVKVDNAAGILKPGMPADVIIR